MTQIDFSVRKVVTIIGVGEIGRTIGLILDKKGHSVHYWDKNQKTLEDLLLEDDLSLPEMVAGSDVVFLCVPSWAMREALLFINPYINKKAIVISLAKGIEEKSLKTPDEMLKSLLPKGQSLAVIGGPMLAEDLLAGRLGFAFCASDKITVAKEVAKLFTDTKIRAFASDDFHGVAICGVLKNIYAVGLGVTVGLKLGDNAVGYYMNKAILEMGQISRSLGAKDNTALSLAGLGDLTATGLSSESCNHQTGILLAEKKSISRRCEGAASVGSVASLIGSKYSKFPIFNAIHKILIDSSDPTDAFAQIF